MRRSRLAPILLIILRLAQGIAVGGEWGGAVLMATEHAPANRRGFFEAGRSGVPVGVILSSFDFQWRVVWFPGTAFLSIGWRVPFLLSVLLVGVGLFIRCASLRRPTLSGSRRARPLIECRFSRSCAITEDCVAAAGFFVINGSFYIFIYLPGELWHGYPAVPASYILNGTLISSVIALAVLPLAGAWTDRLDACLSTWVARS